MVPGPLAITIGQQVVPVSDKHARGCGLPGRFRSGSKRGSGYRAPWMVTEVPADLSRESCSVAFVQPVLIVGHESSVCEDEYMRVGVDPAKMFGRKAGGSGYVVDVDQPRHRRVPGCGHANDTAAVRPAHRSNWRRAGSYGVADFGGILDKSGHRSAVGGQIWRDHLDADGVLAVKVLPPLTSQMCERRRSWRARRSTGLRRGPRRCLAGGVAR